MIEFLHLLISVVVLAIILNGDCVTSILSDDGYRCYGGTITDSSTYSAIGYPFYSEYTNTDVYPVLRNTTYVGYPGFLVNCEDDGRLTSNITTTNLYYIQDIDYSGSTFTAVDVSVDGQECPQPRYNFSASEGEFYAFDYSIDRSYVWMFYNCSSGYPEDTVQHLPCLDDSYNNKTKMNTTSRGGGGGGGRSFAFFEENIPQGFDWYQNCKENVMVRVRSYLIMESDYGQALRAGFQLKFVPNTEECLNCENNVGGYCVHSKQTNAFVGCTTAGDGYGTQQPNGTTTGAGYGTQQPNGTTTGAGYGTHQQKDGSRLSIRLKIIIGVSIGVGGLLLIVLLIYRSTVYSLYNSIVSWKNKIDRPTNVEAFLENYGSLSLQRYKYLDVKKMTNSFKETLGQGGYGTVYKGKLHDDCLVAVKVLNESKGNGEDFINEVAAIGRTNHVNVVSLLGFCTEGNKRALVYEFMSNGSLERFIYNNQQSSTTSTPLGWEKLYHIALGVARGLEYLHRGCNTRILHLDIKPHNILLDQNFCPKISDFGLAKLCPTLESVVSMVGARGTMGYIAPEVCCRHFGGVSHKSDVYSYGMMVLEMIGGRKNIDATVVNISQIYFPHWIYNHLEQGNKVHESEECDVEGSGETFENEKAKKMIIVALWCIQPQPTDRPSMRKVAEMLEGNIEELQMPPNPNMGTQSKYSPSP